MTEEIQLPFKCIGHIVQRVHLMLKHQAVTCISCSVYNVYMLLTGLKALSRQGAAVRYSTRDTPV